MTECDVATLILTGPMYVADSAVVAVGECFIFHAREISATGGMREIASIVINYTRRERD